MIVLHRPENDSFSDEIEETFEDLVLAYKIQQYEEKGPSLPRIEDSEGTVRGEEQIREYLHQLRTDLNSMRSFTGDACYIDPEYGEIC